MTDDKEGLSADDLNLTEQDAFGLSQAAVMLDQAKSNGDTEALAAALDHNLELWVGIRTLVTRPESVVPSEVRDNLSKLADFVAAKTMDKGVEMPRETIESLININLQISEGLLEGNDAVASGSA